MRCASPTALLVCVLVSACHRAHESPRRVYVDAGVSSTIPELPTRLPAEAQCGAPLSMCDERCVDLRFDPRNCGDCGTECQADTWCVDGGCAATRCAEGSVLCHDMCIDPSRDRTYCGAADGCGQLAEASGATCVGGQACVDGACRDCAPLARVELTQVSLDPNAYLYCRSILAGDFDGDGNDDVVATTYFEPTAVQLFLQRKKGQLEAAGRVDLSARMDGMSAVDLDGNGTLDLVPLVSSEPPALLGRGDGTFTPFSFRNPPPAVPYGARPMRLNDDAFPDLVQGIYSAALTLALGRADGQLSPAQTFQLAQVMNSIVVGDFTSDGVRDVLLGQSGTAGLVMLKGSVDGVFEQLPIAFPPGVTGSVAATADFDEDGRLDLLLGYQALTGLHPNAYFTGVAERSLHVARGLGNGAFATPTRLTITGDPGYPEVHDVDGDGHVDIVLVLVRRQGSTPSWGFMRGHGDGSFEEARFHALDYPSTAWPQAALAEVTGDGARDLVTCYPDPTLAIRVQPAQAPAVFPAPRLYPRVIQGQCPLLTVDRDLSARDELVAWDGRDLRVADIEQGVLRTRILAANFAAPEHMLAADLNGDGLQDIAAQTSDRTVWVWRSTGGGTFAALEKSQPYVTLGEGERQSQLLAGDLDGDGRAELMQRSHRDVRAWNLTEHGLAARASIELPEGAQALTVADLNGDSRADLTFFDADDGLLQVWFSNVDGRPTPGVLVAISVTRIEAVQLDTDGVVDLLVERASDKQLIALQGLGGGELAPPRLLDLRCDGGWMLGDVDRDEHSDVICLSGYLTQFAYGDGRGGFAHGPTYARIGWLETMGDFDGDGLVDLASRDWGSNGLILTRGARAEGCP